MVIISLAAVCLGDTEIVARYNAGAAGETVHNPTSVEGGNWQVRESGGAASAVSNDMSQGYNAWKITDRSEQPKGGRSYYIPVTDTQIANASAYGWRLYARLRMVDDFNDTMSQVVLYDSGPRRWVLFFDLDKNGDLVVTQQHSAGTKQHRITADGTGKNVYHEFELIYDPAIKTAKFMADGNLIRSGDAGNPSPYTEKEVVFGTGSSVGQGEANWNLVQWEIFSGIPATIDATLLTLKKLTIKEMDPASEKGKIHVQMLIKNTIRNNAGMIDGIDIGEWVLGAGESVSPNLQMIKVYSPTKQDDLEIVIYNDITGSIGRGKNDTNGRDKVLYYNTWYDFCTVKDKTFSFPQSQYGKAVIEIEKKTVQIPAIVVQLVPCVRQANEDFRRGNELVSVIYEHDDTARKINYWLVYRDEDLPTANYAFDGAYDTVRRDPALTNWTIPGTGTSLPSQYSRIEDVEWLEVRYTDDGKLDKMTIKYGGGQDYNPLPKPYDEFRATFEGVSNISKSGDHWYIPKSLLGRSGTYPTHPLVFSATWNHLLSHIPIPGVTYNKTCTWRVPLIDKKLSKEINTSNLTISK